MKLIIAVIKPFKLDEVREALNRIGVHGMTATEVRATAGRRADRDYRGAEYVVSFMPKIRIEVAVADNRAEDAVQTIELAARTGLIGDGKIFVTRSSAPCASVPARPAKRPSDERGGPTPRALKASLVLDAFGDHAATNCRKHANA